MLALGGPVLLVAAAVGLVIGFLQAITQIQDATVAQIVKIIAVGAVLLLLGQALSGPIVSHSEEIFATFHRHQDR
jgi:type III secretory pathway component EscS